MLSTVISMTMEQIILKSMVIICDFILWSLRIQCCYPDIFKKTAQRRLTWVKPVRIVNKLQMLGALGSVCNVYIPIGVVFALLSP